MANFVPEAGENGGGDAGTLLAMLGIDPEEIRRRAAGQTPVGALQAPTDGYQAGPTRWEPPESAPRGSGDYRDVLLPPGGRPAGMAAQPGETTAAGGTSPPGRIGAVMGEPSRPRTAEEYRAAGHPAYADYLEAAMTPAATPKRLPGWENALGTAGLIAADIFAPRVAPLAARATNAGRLAAATNAREENIARLGKLAQIEEKATPAPEAGAAPAKRLSSYVNDQGQHVDVMEAADGTISERVGGKVQETVKAPPTLEQSYDAAVQALVKAQEENDADGIAKNAKLADFYLGKMQAVRGGTGGKLMTSPFQAFVYGTPAQKQAAKDYLAAAKSGGMFGGGLDTGAPANAGTGAALLAKLPPDQAALVKGVADYEIDPKTLSMFGGARTQVLELARQYDPNFDQSQYNARFRTRQDFTSGKSAQNMRALNTAINHLSILDADAKALGNRSLTGWNWLANWAQRITGNPNVTNFNGAKQAVVSELATVFKGTATEGEIKAFADTLTPNMSPAQMQGAVETFGTLLQGRLEALNDQYQKGMGKPPDFHFLSPEAAESLTAMLPQDQAQRLLQLDGYDVRNPRAGAAPRTNAGALEQRGGEAPENTVIEMPDGTRQVKRGGKWQPQ